MLLPIRPQNVNGVSLDATEPTSSNMHRTSHITLLSTLFKSDLLPFGSSSLFNRLDQPFFASKKADKEPVGEFL